MQVSNSKLNDFQKENRKHMRAHFMTEGGRIFSFPDFGVTICVKPHYDTQVNTVPFSVSIQSPNEQKFRRKVGEYHALNRWESGQDCLMRNPFNRGESETEIENRFYFLAQALAS